MRKSGVDERYFRIVQDTYENSVTAVRCSAGLTDSSKLKVASHQGSALREPILFASHAEINRWDQTGVPMNYNVSRWHCHLWWEQTAGWSWSKPAETWRCALERRGMKVSRTKIGYMCVDEKGNSSTVQLQGAEVVKLGGRVQVFGVSCAK